MSPVRLTVATRRVQSRFLASPLILVYSFVGLIAVGTILLILPFTQHSEGTTPFIDALFTATSAATVTGLTTQDTAIYWTRPGQFIIIVLMFTGGLGFMTIATFLLALIGQRVTPAQRVVVKESLGIDQFGGLARLTVRIVLVVVGIQIIGFLALFTRFSFIYEPGEAAWMAIFHTVSSFNNAGFVALPETQSLSAFQMDPATLGIIGTLILLGGIGWWVLTDLVRCRRFSVLTLNTKLVVILSLTLILLGAGVFFFSEYENPEILGSLAVADKVSVSFFESISSRTAGFSTVDYGLTEQHTNLFFSGLMLIGGASASVAGGIKVNTLAVMLVAVLSTVKGRSRATAFGREIPHIQVMRATAIGAVALVIVCLAALLLTFSEREFAFIDLLFESVSAFGTVGLSTGLTDDLSRWGQIILIVTMFTGRIGPLLLGLTMILREGADIFRYAPERITIG